jgi:hypothetical protein
MEYAYKNISTYWSIPKISPPNGVFQQKYLHLMDNSNENSATLWSIPVLT